MRHGDSPLQVPELPPVDLVNPTVGADFAASEAATGGADDAQSAEPATSTMEISAAQVNPRPTGAAAAPTPPQIPLAPIKRVQARFNPLADGMIYLVVFVGGCVGTGMRYGLGLAMPGAFAESGFWSAFHPATFTANMLACFIFALLTSYVSQATWIRKRTRQLTSRGVGMGMCGGFSTLSAMAVEGLLALQDGHYMGFAFYWAASFVGGLVVSWIGAVLGLRMSSRRAARAVAETLAKHQSQSARHAAVSPAGENQPIDVSAGTVIIHSHRVEIVEQLPVSGPPTGDYGQPLSLQDGAAIGASALSNVALAPSVGDVDAVAASSATAGAVDIAGVEQLAGATGMAGMTGVAGAAGADGAVASAGVADANGMASEATGYWPPAYEPDPITAEIPLAGDPTTGEVRG